MTSPDPDARTEMREMLLSSADRLFSDLCTKEVVNGSEAGEWQEPLWCSSVENGFTAAALPEAAGGAGMALSDALLLGRSLGRHAVPLPIGETIVAGWLLDQAGLAVPEGPLSFGPATPASEVTIEPVSGGRWSFSAKLRSIPWGHAAGNIAVVANGKDGPLVISVATEALQAAASTSLSGEPRARMAIALELPQGSVAPLPGGWGADAALVLGAALRVQQMAGACRAARDLAVRYTQDRIAFGQPLAKLPAVQQNLAVMAGHAAAAGVVADMVIEALDGSPSALALTVGLAKVRAGEAAAAVASMAHQSHGAMGFTFEHVLHHFTRRLWSWRDEFGSEAWWANRAGAELIDGGDTCFWANVSRAAQLEGAAHG